MNTIVRFQKQKTLKIINYLENMLFVNILLFLLLFLILSDLYIKNSPKTKLVLLPINYKIKKKGLFFN